MQLPLRHAPSFAALTAVAGCLAFAAGSYARAQEPLPGAAAAGAPQAAGGRNTGAPQPLQLDAQHRPITAGGFVKTGPIIFENVAQQAGLTSCITRRVRLRNA